VRCPDDGAEAQNSPCRRPEKNEIGPRSGLCAGFVIMGSIAK